AAQPSRHDTAAAGRRDGNAPANDQRVGDRHVPAARPLRAAAQPRGGAGRLPLRRPTGGRRGVSNAPGASPVAPVASYRFLPSWQRIGEPPPDPLDEADLSRIWAAQSFPAAALTLVDGRPLRVVLPGRPGGGAGPDYRDAV